MTYKTPVIATYGQENSINDCMDESKRRKGLKLLRKVLIDRTVGVGYGFCGIGINVYAAANIAAVVNAVAYANAAVATLVAVALAVFPSNSQKSA
jgi:hypothetical protein